MKAEYEVAIEKYLKGEEEPKEKMPETTEPKEKMVETTEAIEKIVDNTQVDINTEEPMVTTEVANEPEVVGAV